MKKFLIVLLVLTVVVTALFAGCAGSTKITPEDNPKAAAGDSQKDAAEGTEKEEAEQTADTSLEDVKAAGKFIVGLDDAFPPMGFRDDSGNIVGFDVDLAKKAAEKMGVEVEFKPIDWGSKEMELNNKNIDMIWNGLTITDERKEKMAFTDPYIANTQIIVVPKDSDIKGKADLAGKKVGVQIESSSKTAVTSDEEAYKSLKELVEYPENLEALMDLKIGRLDAVVVDEILGRYYIAKSPEDYVVLEDNFGSEEYGVGLRLGDEALLAELQRALNEMKEDGSSAEISKQWFGENIVK